MTPLAHEPAGVPSAHPQVTGGDNAAKAASPILSDALLQGRKTVEISHQGAVYRLQATRQGKLILTK